MANPKGMNEISLTNPLPVVDTFTLSVAQGNVSGSSWVLKSGKNPSIDTASVPEDIWGGGSTYTGFPLTAPELVQVVSSNAGDVGILTITYLPTATSTAYVTGTVQLNGTTPVNASFSAYRIHSAFYTDGPTGNLGAITVRWAVTISVVFLVMAIGTNQTYNAGFTIPFGSTGYIYEFFCSVQGNQSVAVDGALWIRESGKQFRLRRNFSAGTGFEHTEDLKGAFVLPSMTDIQIRITTCSANNVAVIGGYNILLVQN